MTLEIPSTNDCLIWDIWFSSFRFPSLTVADELGLFVHLADRAATAGELAEVSGCTRRGLEVLLPMLTSIGLLTCHGGSYHITDATRQYLLPDNPYYWGGLLHRMRETNPHHARLLGMVATGKLPPASNPAETERPADAWASGQVDLERAGQIASFMHSHSQPAAMGMARHGDFSGIKRLLDVGGGSGCFSIALARRYPGLHCSIMDLPTMCVHARNYIADAGMGQQVDTRPVDMFREGWPQGYDALLFSNIFHDWDFQVCAQLAQKAHAALPAGGRIYLHEMLVDDSGTTPATAAAFSILMLLGTDGRQFRFGELRGILEAAGFSDVRVTATYGYYSLISGVKE